MTAFDDLDPDTDETPAGERPTRRPRPFRLTHLDRVILETVLRLGVARAHTVWELVGGSPHTVREHLTRLGKHEYLQAVDVDLWLRHGGHGGKVIATRAHAWTITGRGARRVAPWHPAGYPPEVTITLAAPAFARSRPDHTLGLSELASRYATWGCLVATEREIRAVEMRTPVGKGAQKRPVQPGVRPVIAPTWVTRPLGSIDGHAADLGVVTPHDGLVWAVELERATKTAAEYTRVMGAYRAAGLGQIWHVRSRATWRALMQAAQACGVTWATGAPDGVALSSDGTVRFASWAPGQVLTGTSATAWRKTVVQDGATITVPALQPAVAPAGLEGLKRVGAEKLAQRWQYGRVLTDSTVVWDDGGGATAA